MANEKGNIELDAGLAIYSVDVNLIDSVVDPGLPETSCPELSSLQKRQLWSKIDFRLLPILAQIYTVAILGAENIAGAQSLGMGIQLGLTTSQFNIAVWVYFISYFVFASPANILLRKLPPSRWMPTITVLLGVVFITMGFIETYPLLVLCRFAVGLLEAGILPSIAFYLTFWYPRDKLQTRIGIFYGSAVFLAAMSGLVGYYIHLMAGVARRTAWSWLFIIGGSTTALLGLIAYSALPDFPETAGILSPAQRVYLVNQKKIEYAKVGEDERLEARHLWEALTDWQVWLHTLIMICVCTPLYGIAIFLPSIIEDLGHSPLVMEAFNIPPFVIATIVICASGYYADKLQKRSFFIFGGLIATALGLLINIMHMPPAMKYVGTCLVAAGSYSAFPGVVAWLGNNLSGQYKRGIGMGIQIGVGNLCGIVASLIYRTQDAPQYLFGHVVSAMFVIVGLVAVLVTVVLYQRINRKRNEVLQGLLGHGERLRPGEIKRLGDRSPTFRYMI
ncbi:hypothetical protein APHAL10511_002997 [Amanita phalloides]|nr:hypothetical protein APHAL10511_002997 [Amanita phalloides]